MTEEETAELLARAALIDNRRVDEAIIEAWMELIGDLTLAECRAALVGYYQENDAWVMPSHIRSRVLGERRQWMMAHPDVGPMHPELVPPWLEGGSRELEA